MPKIVDRAPFYDAVQKQMGSVETISRKDVLHICEKYGVDFPSWLVNDKNLRAGRGEYFLENNKTVKSKHKEVRPVAAVAATESVDRATQISMAMARIASPAATASADETLEFSLIPSKEKGYVPFGHFKDVGAIVKSGRFYPIYITGLSGNGKTMMVEQVCAALRRECIRVNITIETDEDDLLGGFRLIDGKTVWQNGPVVHAMERGAVLLLDEVDLGSNKMMCLQPVLEGKPIFLKKINKLITPKEGFNIIATANTKGKGSEDGRFIGTNVMNEAFLERFSITMEQEYPKESVEKKILNNVMKASFEEVTDADKSFVNHLVSWADVIRKSFVEGAVSEIISTRRLVHICQAYAIFDRSKDKAIRLCINRFDPDTMNSFISLYDKLDENLNPPTPAAPVTAAADEEIAF